MRLLGVDAEGLTTVKLRLSIDTVREAWDLSGLHGLAGIGFVFDDATGKGELVVHLGQEGRRRGPVAPTAKRAEPPTTNGNGHRPEVRKPMGRHPNDCGTKMPCPTGKHVTIVGPEVKT